MHHFVVFMYLPMRRFKTTVSKRFKLPHACTKKVILLDLNHILLVGTKALSSVLCPKVLKHLKCRYMVLHLKLWRKPLLLYYFVLVLRIIEQVLLIIPFLSRWKKNILDLMFVSWLFCFGVLFGFLSCQGI